MSETQNRCLAKDFRARVQEDPEQVAIIAGDLNLSRVKLLTLAENYAVRFQAAGVHQGDIVSVISQDAIVLLASIFALSMVGAVFIPFDASLVERKDLQSRHFFRSVDTPPIPHISDHVIDASWSPKAGSRLSDGTMPYARLDGSDQAWLMPSSGTTGHPKFISLNNSLLMDRLEAISEDFAGSRVRVMLHFPPNSRAYCIRAVALLLHGHVLVESTSSTLAETSKVDLICASPQQIRPWLRGVPASLKIPVLQLSGSRVTDEMLSSLFSTFEVVEDVYGSNETIKAHINTYKLSGNDVCRGTRECASIVQIVDEAGSPVPLGQEGQIRIKNKYMADGYLNEPKKTQHHFRSGWFYPGDLGYFTNDKLLRVTGRLGEIINVGGQKVALSDIEAFFEGIAGVDVVCCFRNPEAGVEAEIAACLACADTSVMIDQVESAWLSCVRTLGPSVAPSLVLLVPKLKVTADGVPDRMSAQRTFNETIAHADENDLKKRLFRFRVEYDS